MADPLRLIVRTPTGIACDARLQSARIPSGSGAIGLRPREEPFVTVVEPGLVLLRGADTESFASTAGGLLRAGRMEATLYTPFAAVAETAEEVLAALDRALSEPRGDIAARRRLAELETRLARELRVRPAVPRTRGSRA